MKTEDRIAAALILAAEFGSTDGAQHKEWVIDQIVRILTADRYQEWVQLYKAGANGPDTYHWPEGIAP